MNSLSGKLGTVAAWSDGIVENWIGFDAERLPNTPVPSVGRTRQGLDGLDIFPNHQLSARNHQPATGLSAVWKYKAIYRLGNEQVGQWSDVATVAVVG